MELAFWFILYELASRRRCARHLDARPSSRRRARCTRSRRHPRRISSSRAPAGPADPTARVSNDASPPDAPRPRGPPPTPPRPIASDPSCRTRCGTWRRTRSFSSASAQGGGSGGAHPKERARRRALDGLDVPHFDEFVVRNGADALVREPTTILQVNIGLYCNQACSHCTWNPRPCAIAR